MNERFIATSRRGDEVVRTNSAHEAAHYADLLRGTVIDTLERAQ